MQRNDYLELVSPNTYAGIHSTDIKAELPLHTLSLLTSTFRQLTLRNVVQSALGSVSRFHTITLRGYLLLSSNIFQKGAVLSMLSSPQPSSIYIHLAAVFKLSSLEPPNV
jgi:hypothetical protein